jgi:hypothetical protein
MKKLLSAIITAVLAFSIMSAPAFAADKTEKSASKPYDDGVELYDKVDSVYDNRSIIKLVKFDASRNTNEAIRRQIMMINQDITYTIERDVNVAEGALRDETYEGNFEIRAFKYESDKFLQVVATSIEYPTYGRDPDVYSFVYDRVKRKYVRVSDALAEDGLTEEEVLADAEKLYTAAGPEYLFGGKICGIYMEDDDTRSYILRMNQLTPVADDWLSVMTYIPGKYTEDGEPILNERVEIGENFNAGSMAGSMAGSIEYTDTDNSNDIIMNVRYEAENGDYIRFMRDRYAVISIGGKLSVRFYYKTADTTVTFNQLTGHFDGTLTGRDTLTLNIGGKDLVFKAKA